MSVPFETPAVVDPWVAGGRLEGQRVAGGVGEVQTQVHGRPLGLVQLQGPAEDRRGSQRGAVGRWLHGRGESLHDARASGVGGGDRDVGVAGAHGRDGDDASRDGHGDDPGIAGGRYEGQGVAGGVGEVQTQVDPGHLFSFSLGVWSGMGAETRGARLGAGSTVVVKVCAAVEPPGSVAVTVTSAVPGFAATREGVARNARGDHAGIAGGRLEGQRVAGGVG